MKKPELLAPAGGFDAACQAFEAGADGVYLGLGEFSARKAAANFTPLQLRRIRTLGSERGGRIYVALNTVIRENEMRRAAESIAWLEAIGVDAVIVQDLGLCSLIRRGFPGLAVFASTQMAVHNDSGLEIAEDMGIRRVILSRELTFDRIRDLRARHPGIELEVFIHGALCYSFSGLCLASGALTGRSGNRGECAQICRSLFSRDEGARENACDEGHFFSCRDLSLGTDILKLAEIGIDSFKIEGRMKSPEYVYHTTRLYRRILDDGPRLDAGEHEELLRNAETTFSRARTTGWFASASTYPADLAKGSRLLETGFPGHRGSPLGTVASVRGRQFSVKLRADISLRDGIGFWPPRAQEPFVYSLRRIAKAGRDVTVARAGDTVFLSAPDSARDPAPAPGDEIRLFSSRFLDRAVRKEDSIDPVKVPVDLEIRLVKKGDSSGLLLSTGAGVAAGFSFERPITVEQASGRRVFAELLKNVLHESGDSLLRPGKIAFVNDSGFADDGIFVPPSQLKRAKNDLYAALEAHVASMLAAKAASACETRASTHAPVETESAFAALADRDMISPPALKPVPFASLAAAELTPGDLASVDGFLFVPLPPVCPDDSLWAAALSRLARAHPGQRVAIGLNNVGHVALARELSDHENIFFFVDFYLYAANSHTLSFVRARVPRVLFAYSWIEGSAADHDALASAQPRVPLIRVDASFSPPLFYSLGCFQRHAVRMGACPDGCPKDFTGRLRQGRNRFRLVVRDCVTWLFQEKKDTERS